ncbi:MAG TPA: sigma-54 dependent transcriptional regulator [Kaistiaceae bacterium]|nr:sigma-54 dependent transcriptional regulator [Kaistiaceae bacterium]
MVLLADGDGAQRRLLKELIRGQFGAHVEIDEAASARTLDAFLDRHAYDLVVVDLSLCQRGATEISQIAGRAGAPLVVTSAAGSVNSAVTAMRSGADDFLIKPFPAAAFLERVTSHLAGPARRIGTAEAAGGDFEGFVGTSPAMLGIYDQITRIAPSKAPVFISGESGTGKEVCAEAVHARSGRAEGPFIALNCGAIPKDLMESEIFGHVRGAFTGASEDRPGAAELADGGTLFLDEIGEMDLALQAKLLRFIQTGTVRRVGATKTQAVDVRIVCATNRDPYREVSTGRFREDLFYRLHVLPIHLPPLRERPGDILPLAARFLADFSEEEGRAFTGFEPDAERLLAAWPWPGNVRELQNVIRRVVVLSDGERVAAAMLPIGGPVTGCGPVTGYGPVTGIGQVAGSGHATGSASHSGHGPSAGAGAFTAGGHAIGGATASTAHAGLSSIGPMGTHIPAMPRQATGSAMLGAEVGHIAPFWQQEQQIIETALAAFDGNISRAAAALEISPSTIYRKKQAWGERVEG